MTLLATHPWISFKFDLTRAHADLWLDLGEVRSKCVHLSGVPLMPEIAAHLHKVYLAKGIHATTAIEGNTLSESQVQRIIEKEIEVPESMEYQAVEVENILALTNEILGKVEGIGFTPITVEEVKQYNKLVLQGLDTEEHVEPGEFRKCAVGVLRYEAPDHAQCHDLMAQFVDWLNGPDFRPQNDEHTVINGIIKSIIAHLYLAWIHPFGDGNGRTARMLEVRFLLEAGVPSAAAHLLSNHYNFTRSEYYRQLDYASKSGGDVIPFISYAVTGLRDQIREQLKKVKYQQWHVAWTSYVYSRFKNKENPKDVRQLKLVLALSQIDSYVKRSDIRELSAEVALAYSKVEERTFYRDLKELVDDGLIGEHDGQYWACKELILAFLPRSRKGEVAEQVREAISLSDGSLQLNLGF